MYYIRFKDKYLSGIYFTPISADIDLSEIKECAMFFATFYYAYHFIMLIKETKRVSLAEFTIERS